VKGQHYADVVRRLVREARPDLASPGPSGPPPGGERLVSAVEQALRARARRRAVGRRVLAGATVTFAAAAALALVAGYRSRGAPETVAASTLAPKRSRALTVIEDASEAGGAVVANGGSAAVAVKSGMPIAAGLTLHAPATGEVRIGTADGTSLALEGGGELAVTESGATQRFVLRGGAVTARVSRLFAGERFIVDTRDAQVEVRGTAFRVAVVPPDARCGDGTTTRVSVFEGVVRVRAAGREVSVAPGGAWPEGCRAPVARAEQGRERAVAVAHRARQRDAEEKTAAPVESAASLAPPAPAVVPSPSPALSSSLGAENDLFAAAVRAKRQGRAEEAARLFGELVAGHPASPLVESAMAQRMKALAGVDPGAAARAATAYLDRFPNGFARPEARQLAGLPSP
jgi:hypothetical protein